MKYNSPNVSPLFSVGNRMFLLLIALLSVVGRGYAQNPAVRVFEDWNTTSGTQNNFQRSIVRSKGIGGATYYYLCGSTINSSGNYDLLIQKKNASGVVLWAQTYNGTGNGNDYAADVQIDAVGNVYICGTYYKNSTDSNNAVLIKYNNAGTHQWTQVFNGAGSGHDALAAIQLTSDGILVAGTTWQNSTDMYDMLVMRYDTTGSLIWSQNWDYNDLNDIAVNLYSSRSRIYVAGGVQSAATTYKYGMFTVLYSDGSYQGSVTSGGTAFGFDQLTAIQYDDSGYVYLTGGVLNLSTGYDIKTIKLDTLLNTVWSATYTSAGTYNDVGTGLALDSAGNIFVTGYKTSATSGKDYVTIKYSSGGTQRWVSTFDGGINADVSATAIVVNPIDTNKIYVTGFSYNGSTKDYWTLKYDGAGNLKWNIGFNNTPNTDDRATSIALDTLGYIIVAGQNKLAWNSHTYTTVKYIEKSTTLPQDTISATSNSFVFTENRGQLFGTDSAVHPEVKFYTIHGTPQVYFTDTAVSYVFSRVDTTTATDSIVRVNMTFKNANANLKIRSIDQRAEVNNFYCDFIPGGGREQVHNYNQLVSFDVWNNVDMIYGSNLNGLKYYFVCKPGGGGNPATQIDLLYKGSDSVKINGSGQLVIYTRLGNIIQPKASAWQLDATGNFSSLGWQPSYTMIGTNEVGFTGFGSFNTAYPLIIAVDWGDVFPVSILNLDWSTYFGGNNTDVFFDLDVSQTTGNSYYAGWSWSTTFPSQNSYQTLNSGNDEAVAAEFDSVGALKFSTYYGTGPFSPSPSYQAGRAAAVTSTGDLVIGGRTRYQGVNIGFPLAQPAGAFVDTSFSGSGSTEDAFFAKFAEGTGNLIWATYYGGSGYESVRDIIFDKDDNLYAVIDADTNTPRVFRVGAFNDSSDRNGMILKFDWTLNLIWATMYGTDNGTTVALAYDPLSFNLYVTGQARTGGLPLTDPGGAYMDTTLSGLYDGYISEFNAADTLVWSTYIGGTGVDYGLHVAVRNGEVVAVGGTSSNNFPFYYSGLQYIDSTNNGSLDLYIIKFNSGRQRIWSTYYGGSLGEGATGSCTYDYSGNLYIGDVTNSTNLDVVNSAYAYFDSTCACAASNLQDGYFLGFNNQNQLMWGTYFGGTQHEYPTYGLEVYHDSLLYSCGESSTQNTAASPWPAEQLSGAFWQPNCDPAWGDATITRFTLDPLLFIGVEERAQPQNNSSMLNVFPNPSDGEFHVVVTSNATNKVVEVYNSLGQIIETVKLSDALTSQSISLNLSKEGVGVYLVVLRDDNGTCSQRVIKQ